MQVGASNNAKVGVGEAIARGIEPEVVANKLIEALCRDGYEVGVGQARDLMVAARIAPQFSIVCVTGWWGAKTRAHQGARSLT